MYVKTAFYILQVFIYRGYLLSDAITVHVSLPSICFPISGTNELSPGKLVKRSQNITPF